MRTQWGSFLVGVYPREEDRPCASHAMTKVLRGYAKDKNGNLIFYWRDAGPFKDKLVHLHHKAVVWSMIA
jgi:hypothetical protein